VCNSGYIKNDTSCDDVDECLLSTDDCELKSTCVNTLGSFECHCVEDVVGRGTFTDPCSRNVCNISIPFDGLHARYRASGWDAERNVWFDSSGNSGMDSVSVRGSPVFGSSGSLNFLSGGVGDGFVLGAGSIPEFFTVCSLSRYTSSLTGRILGSTSSGWFHGHDGGFSGAASYGGLLSSGDASATTDWVYMCGRNAESDALVVNGILKRAANGSFSESGNQQLTVNADGSGEHSDWAVSEVLVWDRHLNVTEMLSVSDYLSFLLHGCIEGCVSGYEFSTASMSCVDVDECASGLFQCANDTSHCVNTVGGYDCVEYGCSSLYHPGGTSPCTLDDCNERLSCLVRYCCSLEDDAWGGEDLSDPDCRISTWDTSGVTKLDFLFAAASNSNSGHFLCWNTFNGDISKWDVSSVTSAYRVFRTYILYDDVRGISGFQGDISKWDVSSVQNMEGFFLGIGNLTSDLSKWNTSSVTSMYYMFHSTVFNGDISSWDVSSVKFMDQMFHSSTFNRDISAWDVSSLESAWQMFRNTQFYEQSLCAWRLEDSLRTADGKPTVMGAGSLWFFLDAHMYGVLWGCPVNLCLSGSHSCDPQARCDFDVFEYTCSCNAGYAGDGFSCANVDECASSPPPSSCGVNTVCEDTEGSFLCLCADNSVFVG